MSADHSQEEGGRAAFLADLLARARAAVAQPSASQTRLVQRLDVLRERLLAARFQLAVVGQFKRGKSTLLNALLGVDAVPTGVVPVTAIPTFFVAGESPRLTVSFLDGRTETRNLADPGDVRAALDALVTEAHNPDNVLGIARVEVALPSPLLARGVVLIDTPGVGSTLEHNTAAAHAALAECDAALFVVSPDPPITEAEVAYLARVRPAVASLHVVLNKIDLLEAQERPVALDFLRRVLADATRPDPAPPVFCVSARQAVRAREQGDADGWQASGLAELETHLVRFLSDGKQAALCSAVARKAASLMAELRLDIELGRKALALPLDNLARRLEAFDQAAAGFEVERRTAHDGIAGDRARALRELEADAVGLRQAGCAALGKALDGALARGVGAEAVRQSLAGPIHEFFEQALAETSAAVGRRLAEVLAVHQRRADELVGLVRRTAADLLEVPFQAPAGEEAFEPRRRPFWVTRRREDLLDAIPVGAFERFLSAAARQARQRRRLVEEIEAVVWRNVENLRWASRQNIEDAFREFGSELDARLAASLEATRGAMAFAIQRRRTHRRPDRRGDGAGAEDIGSTPNDRSRAKVAGMISLPFPTRVFFQSSFCAANVFTVKEGWLVRNATA